jgi:hypothetical protein
MLKMLLGVKPFSGFIGHLIHHQAILLAFSGGFNLLYVI